MERDLWDKMTKTEFLLGLNRKYLDRKCLKQDLRYQAPEVIQSIIVSSDQVLALVDMLEDMGLFSSDLLDRITKKD
jgi:hypothetical protein